MFFATGRRADAKIWAWNGPGCELNDKGAMIVDEKLRTAAAYLRHGDVTDRINLTPVATAEGHALGRHLFGKTRAAFVRNVPSAVFSTPPVATVGLTEEQAGAPGRWTSISPSSPRCATRCPAARARR